MTRILVIISLSSVVALLTSCGCCTSDSKPPALRPLPKFSEIPSAPEPSVHVEPTK